MSCCSYVMESTVQCPVFLLCFLLLSVCRSGSKQPTERFHHSNKQQSHLQTIATTTPPQAASGSATNNPFFIFIFWDRDIWCYLRTILYWGTLPLLGILCENTINWFKSGSVMRVFSIFILKIRFRGDIRIFLTS